MSDYLKGLFGLLDKNVEPGVLLEYANSQFTEDNIKVIANLELQINARFFGKQEGAPSARKSTKIGTYAYNDKRGIEYLAREADGLMWASGLWAVAAIFATVLGVLAAAPTFGLAAILGSVIALISGAMAAWTFGLAKDALKEESTALNLCERGQSYTIYKETGLFGIPTGYSVY
ncbi:MAG: hypothetical protein FWD76_04695 [Firmicutes bacterium]|nr:hypothetical protein [Bacillota bacterium]